MIQAPFKGVLWNRANARSTHVRIRVSGALALIPGQVDAMARQLFTSTRMLGMKGHRRHMAGLTGWIVQTLSQKAQ